MTRQFIRVRGRNQITLPHGVANHLNIASGGVLEYRVRQGRIELYPAKIAAVGSAEAKLAEREAIREINEGEFTSIRSVEEFDRHLDSILGKNSTAAAVHGASSLSGLSEVQKQEITALVETALEKYLKPQKDPKTILAAHASNVTERSSL